MIIKPVQRTNRVLNETPAPIKKEPVVKVAKKKKVIEPIVEPVFEETNLKSWFEDDIDE